MVRFSFSIEQLFEDGYGNFNRAHQNYELQDNNETTAKNVVDATGLEVDMLLYFLSIS